MNLKRIQLTVMFAMSFFLMPSQAQVEIASNTIDGGGTTSSGGSFELSGTIGQPDAGNQTTGSFQIEGGFWTSEHPTVPVELMHFEIVQQNHSIGRWVRFSNCSA